MILQLLKHGLVQHYHEPLLAGHHDLQELAKTYRQVTLARKRLADSLLNHYLPLYFPEIARYLLQDRRNFLDGRPSFTARPWPPGRIVPQTSRSR